MAFKHNEAFSFQAAFAGERMISQLFSFAASKNEVPGED
ncbi:hypothetical protein PMI18_04605 [Pseudomonas sp. GM102]|nr:hypothetical protein PMI18_04605 [Pseudomonas sp. GM102]